MNRLGAALLFAICYLLYNPGVGPYVFFCYVFFTGDCLVIIARSTNDVGTVLIIDGVFRTKYADAPVSVGESPIISVYPEPSGKASFNGLFSGGLSAPQSLLGKKSL